MKTRPILFSPQMVRALLDGRKTQTRRTLNPQPDIHRVVTRSEFCQQSPYSLSKADCGGYAYVQQANGMVTGFCSPYGKPGDLLWVRETWQKSGLGWGNDLQAGKLHYRATDDGEWKDYWGGWKPSIHMPRWASRLTLEITGVRVERLNEISNADAIAEGLELSETDDGGHWYSLPEWNWQSLDPGQCYLRIWEEINGKGSSLLNPWVWVLEFRAHQQNVDDLLKQRAA